MASKLKSAGILVLVIGLVTLVVAAWWGYSSGLLLSEEQFTTPGEKQGRLPLAKQIFGKKCELKFAVIGDYGKAGKDEAAVAELVKSWDPNLIITTGDNNYPNGEAATIDANIGQYYQEYIYPYIGKFGAGADRNRFFPSLGNHDWHTPKAVPYLEYFELPGNERYYDFTRGPVHFFALDSSSTEPDGITSTSAQAQWLKERMSASTSPWQVVYLHHAPYSSSSNHGSAPVLQWPYQEWGADLVLSGHDHVYERLEVDELTYVVNGLGGSARYGFGTWLADSKARFRDEYGAMNVNATPEVLEFSFMTVDGEVIDTFKLTQENGSGECANT